MDEIEKTGHSPNKSEAASHSLDGPADQKIITPQGEVAVTVIQGQSYSGPMPPPQWLAQYDEALPGAADRIISMAEREQAADHDSRRLRDRSDACVRVGGLAASLVVSVVAIGASAYCVVVLNSWPAATTAGLLSLSGIVQLVRVFMRAEQDKPPAASK